MHGRKRNIGCSSINEHVNVSLQSSYCALGLSVRQTKLRDKLGPHNCICSGSRDVVVIHISSEDLMFISTPRSD
jgi:hypothetical protein